MYSKKLLFEVNCQYQIIKFYLNKKLIELLKIEQYL